MTRIYRIKARPFWDHWQVSTSFFGTTLSLGGLLIAIAWPDLLLAAPGSAASLPRMLAGLIALGLAMELTGLLFHARDMQARGNEGAVAYHEQTTVLGYTYWLRNGLTVLAMAVAAPAGLAALLGWSVAAGAMLTAAVIGRALFYVLVIPTTMPGAFFWRNKGFEAHARETGLAEWQQVGVAPETH